jgi:putative transcriptional regulator
MSHEDFEELCSLYVLGLLDQTEKSLLESHLQMRCSTCDQILKETAEVCSLFPYASSMETPPPRLKQKLLDQIQAGMIKKPFPPVQYVIHPAEGPWLPSPIPGIDVQHLWSLNGRTARLLRSRPGVTFPPHRHQGPEIVYVLEGNLVINGKSVAAGDFCISDPGFVDRDLRTEEGCTLLVISNDDDEFL